MPDVPVTLTPWFDAKDNPPDGDLSRDALLDWQKGRTGTGAAAWASPDAEFPAARWAELPSSPDLSDPLGPLTVKDLRYALQSGIADAEDDALIFHVSDPNGVGEQVFARRAARLRRALDHISTHERKDDT